MGFNYYGFSDIGKKQTIMEDAFSGFIVDEKVLFLCIADGLGAKKGTDIASMIAIEEFRKYMISNLKTDEIGEIEKEVKKATYMINRMIFAYRRMDLEMYGNFSSTFTVVAVNLRKEILISHIGDTRLYLFRQGELVKMTKDDSIAQELIEKKEIQESEYDMHPDRGVLTKYLGMPEVEPFITKGTLIADDILLLISNGVYEMLPAEKIKHIFVNTKSSQQACEWIIEGSNKLGGLDNSSVLISYINW